VVADIHATTIIEDTLDVSYEGPDDWVSSDGNYGGYEPATAVLLVTRCCKINHDHINLNKSQANKLELWLHAFVNGEYDE
jgi:hypothetical protein